MDSNKLKEKYEFDREGYTSAKSYFIKKITEQSKKRIRRAILVSYYWNNKYLR